MQRFWMIFLACTFAVQLHAAPLPPVNKDTALYIVPVDPGVTYDDVVTSLKIAAEGKNFVNPANFPIGEHIRQRGQDAPAVLEVRTYCSLGIGAEIFKEYPEFAAFAPCRIAIYEKKGQLYMALDRPTYDLRYLGDVSPAAQKAAQEVEDTLIWMMDKARKGDI